MEERPLEKRFPHCNVEILKKLQEAEILDRFSQIISYVGDLNLNHSCNDEYSLDVDECIITNGITNTVMERVDDGSIALAYATAVRGASYVIIVEFIEGKIESLDLRIDEPDYASTIEEIKKALENIEKREGTEDMGYYLMEYRADDEYIVHNNDYA